MLANRSPAVMTPTMHSSDQGDHQPEVAADAGAGRSAAEPAPVPVGASRRHGPRRPIGRRSAGCRSAGAVVLARVMRRVPSMTRSSTWCSSMLVGGAVVHAPAPRRPPGPGRPDPAPPRSRWTPPRRRPRGRPASGRARRSRLRAPTSTPRVGSSSSSTRHPRSSQRASTTFCWLPPDSVRTIAVDVRRAARRAPSTCSCAAARSAASSRKPPRGEAGEAGDA